MTSSQFKQIISCQNAVKIQHQATDPWDNIPAFGKCLDWLKALPLVQLFLLAPVLGGVPFGLYCLSFRTFPIDDASSLQAAVTVCFFIGLMLLVAISLIFAMPVIMTMMFKRELRSISPTDVWLSAFISCTFIIAMSFFGKMKICVDVLIIAACIAVASVVVMRTLKSKESKLGMAFFFLIMSITYIFPMLGSMLMLRGSGQPAWAHALATLLSVLLAVICSTVVLVVESHQRRWIKSLGAIILILFAVANIASYFSRKDWFSSQIAILAGIAEEHAVRMTISRNAFVALQKTYPDIEGGWMDASCIAEPKTANKAAPIVGSNPEDGPVAICVRPVLTIGKRWLLVRPQDEKKGAHKDVEDRRLVELSADNIIAMQHIIPSASQ